MKPAQILSLSFGAVMVVVVLALAALMAFTDVMSERLYGGKRIFFIVLMIAYAIYRGYRMYSQLRVYKQRSLEDN